MHCREVITMIPRKKDATRSIMAEIEYYDKNPRL